MNISSLEAICRKLVAGPTNAMPPESELSRRFCVQEMPAGLSQLIVRLGRDQSGVSAVEFAMLLPLMITMYLGTVEVSQAVGIDRKVTLTARTVADLASQVSSINNADMTNLLQASSAVITPYDSSKLKVTVTRVDIDASGNAKVVWSDSLGGTPRAANSAATVPTALKIANTSLIWSEVGYTYTPTIGYVITGSLNLSDQLYMRARLSDSVTRVNS
jgi:Flp pilus assembly protein TadG